MEAHGRELVTFLSRGGNYPHAMGRVALVQTHISWVFLGREDVYKVKKPVTFSFLDFGTLQKRYHFLQEEFRLNQRLAPELYEGLVPIRRDGRGRLTFRGEGPVVEWALRMRRFPESASLAHRLREDVVTQKDMTRVAGTLARFYQRERKRGEAFAFDPATLIGNNLRQASEVLVSAEEQNTLAWLWQTQRAHLRSLEPWIADRRSRGWVVDGHGDLHAEHILFLDQPKPHVAAFDCIEFNPAFRRADVAYDMSFLVMDLISRGHPALALHFLGTLEKRLGGESMTVVQACYAAHRAAIRAKVNGLKAKDDGVPGEERDVCAAQADYYLQTALRLAHLGVRPRWVVVMGNIASGKSTLARTLGECFGVEVLNSDVARKELHGMAPTEPGADKASVLYSPQATERTYGAMIHRAAVAAKEGRPVILDATWHTRARRDQLWAGAARAGVRADFLYLQVPAKVLRQRLKDREGRDTVSDARLPLLKTFSENYEVPGADEGVCLLRGTDLQRKLRTAGAFLAGRLEPPSPR